MTLYHISELMDGALDRIAKGSTRSIADFPGYEIKNDGSIWSFWRSGPYSGITAKLRRLKTRLNNNGYEEVGLMTNGRQRMQLVHRLVLTAFVGPCPPGMQACHCDGNRTNNCLENLRWDLVKNNHRDKFTHGTIARGERNGNSHLSNEQVSQIRRMRQEGKTHKQIANEVGCAASTVGRIVRNQSRVEI